MNIGGIDAQQIVTSLLELEQRPLFALESRKNNAQTAVEAIGRIRSNVESFKLAGSRLADLSTFSRFKTSVSNPSAVSASVSGTAVAGSLSFNVAQLARAHGLRSTGKVSSASVPVTSASVIAVAAGTLAVGVNTVRAGAGLGVGEVTFEVVQASAGASSTGTSALGTTTVIDGTNDSLSLTVNGNLHTVTIANGTYDAEGLVAAVQEALDTSSVDAIATLDGSGALVLTTEREGSSANLQVTASSALTPLGLTADASARTGTDGIFDVGGTTTTVTQAEAGQAVAIDTGSGILDVVLSGGLRVGTTVVDVVSTGDRSLGAVAAAINGASNGVSAAAVRVTTGSWLLQLGATKTGLDGHIAIDGSVLDELGGLVETSAAQNARLRIGEGAGAYDVEASGNTFTNVVSGVTITAKEVTTTAVTVGVDRNDDAIATDIAAMISNANKVLAEIKVQTRYDATSGSSGALSGNSTIRRLADQIRKSLSGEVNGVPGVLAATAGIQLTREGSFTFDKATFISAMQDDPALISRLFSRGGTATGDAVFATATAETVSGSYAVEVTTAATRATSATLFDGGAVADGRVGVRIGSITATFDVTNGQSADQIIDGLNNAIAEAGLKLVVEADGTGLRVRHEKWGSGGNFELNTDVLGAGTWDAQAGVDVVGTIAGVAATGVGRRLSLGAFVDSGAAGLGIDITEGVTGTLGPVEYLPGIAARVVELATLLTDVDNGTLTTATQSAERVVTDFNDQITRLEDRLVIREANLRRQWSSLQTLLGGLENQNNWISGQLSSLNNNWAGN